MHRNKTRKLGRSNSIHNYCLIYPSMQVRLTDSSVAGIEGTGIEVTGIEVAGVDIGVGYVGVGYGGKMVNAT